MAAIVLCTINAKWIHPSLALRLLRANLPENTGKENSVILEFALRQRPEEKTAAVLAEAPEILALSVSVWNHEATLELLRALEQEWAKGGSRPVIVLGGPEITGLAETAEEAAAEATGSGDPADSARPPDGAPVIFRYADFVVCGEGELVFAELCRAVLEDPKAAKKRFGTVIRAGAVNPATVKSGYEFYTGEDIQKKLMYVEASRGCPYACAFCQSARKPERGEPPVRYFPLEPFLSGVENLLNRATDGAAKTRTIKFLDRSFNVNIPRALKILEFCLTKAKKGFQFHFEMVPALFPRELRDMLAQFPPGSIRLEIGIQSFNPHTCALINRASNPEEEAEVLRFLREKTNAILHADLIAGLPGEDLDSYGRGFDFLWTVLGGGKNKQTAEGIETARPFEIQPGILKCLPGTPVRAMIQDGSFAAVYNKTAPYEVIETDSLSAADMEKIKNFSRFWELIVNRNPFPELLPRLLPPETPVFSRFMEVSQKLLGCFGKNWGIPKRELERLLSALFL